MWMRNLVNDYINVQEREAKTAFVSFDTPLRIISGKELCRVPTFLTLTQFIIRRASLVSQIFSDKMLEWDEDVLFELASSIKIVDKQLRFVNFERYSINQLNNKIELPAVEGWILYEGDLRVLTSVLEVGRLLHVGKGTTLGFGHYEVFYDG